MLLASDFAIVSAANNQRQRRRKQNHTYDRLYSQQCGGEPDGS